MFLRLFRSKTISNLCNLFRPAGYSLNHKFYSNKSNVDNVSPDFNLETDQVTKLLEDAASYNESTDTSWSTMPYPQGAPTSLDDTNEKRPKIEPSDKTIVLFSGQGSLKVGAVKEYLPYPGVKELFEAANEVLKEDLLELCLKGPQQVLNRTEYNQPATVVTCLAAMEKLYEERPRAIDNCVGVTGYSVGEITALIFAGVMNLESGIKLVGIRAAAMQAAANETPQGMIFAFCTSTANTSEICKQAESWALDAGVVNPHCSVAIYLYPQGKIFAGSKEAIQYIQNNSSALGLRMLRKIPVSGAFHTKLMKPAVQPFVKALQNIELHEPNVSVYSNVTSHPYNNIKDIIKYLPRQIITPIKWEQIMHVLYKRPQGTTFPRTFDVGSNGTLKTILSHVNGKACECCITV